MTEPRALFFTATEIEKHRKESGKLYREFLRVPSTSAGLYVLAPGATDPQSPHREDEMYYVVRGRAHFRAGDEDREIASGDVLFVAKNIEHRFHDISEELALLVFFAPAES